MGRRVRIAGVVAGVALIGVGVALLLGRGLDAADKLASVGSLVVGVLSLAVAVWSLRRAPAAAPSTVKRVAGQVKGGSVGGTVVGAEAGRDADEVVGVVDVGDVLPGGTVLGARLTDRDDERDA